MSLSNKYHQMCESKTKYFCVLGIFFFYETLQLGELKKKKHKNIKLILREVQVGKNYSLDTLKLLRVYIYIF